ncbi:hypothetical protein H5T88_05575 [bacterium]|nr:hypothetical protein [bacterium]
MRIGDFLKKCLPLFLLLFTIPSHPLPFLYFALGLDDEKELSEYKEWGFNSIWVDITFQDKQMEKKEALIKEAVRQELLPIICLHLETPDFGSRSPINKDYQEKTSSWVRSVVERFKDLPRLVWALGYDPSGAIEYSESDFLSYLLMWYGSFPNLSQAWGKELNFPEEVNLKVVQELSADKEGEIPHYGISRASLDLALYKWWSLRDLLNLWLGEIKGADIGKERWVITGMLKDYKSIVSVPPGYDGVTLALYPGEVEMDFLAHNPHGVAMARRGGLFTPITILHIIKEGEYKTTPYLLQEWLNNAYIEGAGGIGFDNWAILKELKELKELIRRNKRQNPLQPQNRIAVLYEPFLEGFNLEGRGLYGFLQTPLINQPSDLFFALRFGSAYGGIDYLSVEDLDKVNIFRYKVILAPSAFLIPPSAEELLQSFILMGGILVADIGFACYEGGTLASANKFLRNNFGLDGFFTITKGRGNFRVNIEHPLFPLLKKNKASDGNAKGFAVDGCIGFVYVGGKTDILATLGALVGAGGRMAVAGILIKKVGLGWGIYATFPLWRNWLPYNKLFNEFHQAILSWRADSYLLDALFPQTGRMMFLKDGIALLNLAPQKNALIYITPFEQFFPSCVTAPLEGNLKEIIVPLNEYELRILSNPVPLQVQPSDLTVHIESYTPNKVELKIVGRGGKILLSNEKTETIPSFATLGTIILGSGEYKIEKGSLHKITVTNCLTGEKKSWMAKADEGYLKIEWSFHSEKIEIERGSR